MQKCISFNDKRVISKLNTIPKSKRSLFIEQCILKCLHVEDGMIEIDFTKLENDHYKNTVVEEEKLVQKFDIIDENRLASINEILDF